MSEQLLMPIVAASSGKRRGRPAGSRNEVPAVIVIEPSRCPACGSLSRSEYWGRSVEKYDGMHNGRRFRKIIRRRTRCLDCGQLRIDKQFC